MKNPLAGLMQQAQKMQENMKKAQDELAASEVQGESGGGLVKVTMSGRKEMRRIEIDDSLLQEDRDMLEDLIVAAVNDAVNRANRMKEDKLADLTGGLPLPGDFKMPF